MAFSSLLSCLDDRIP